MLTLVFPTIVIASIPPILLAGVMETRLPTAPNTVAFTHGLPRWIALARGQQTARAAVIMKDARRPIRCVAYALRDGICLRKRNGMCFSLRLAVN